MNPCAQLEVVDVSYKMDQAIGIASALRSSLAEEVEASREARDVLCGLEAELLLDRARDRARFNDEATRLRERLAGALAEVGTDLGLEVVTLEHLGRHLPQPTRRLEGVLSEIASLAGALAELDALNRHLGHRALAVIGAYLSALAPSGLAYDRHGLMTGGARAPSTTSHRV